MVSEVLLGMLGNTIYDAIKKTLKDKFTEKDEDLVDRILNAFKKASAAFFEKYSSEFGDEYSGFLARDSNIDAILKSVFYGNNDALEQILSREGFDGASDVTLGALQYFVDSLNKEMMEDFRLNKIIVEKGHISDSHETLKKIDHIITLLSKQIPQIENSEEILAAKERFQENRLFSISPNISDEIISRIKTEEYTLTYRECAQWMEEKQITCIQIIGEGGTGKTSFLVKLAAHLNEEVGKTAIYIRLNDLNELSSNEKKRFLEAEIRRQNPDTIEREGIFLLLDGFNEVKNGEKFELSNQIKNLLIQRKVSIILASRRKLDATVGIYGIGTFTMEHLQEEQIERYLKQNNIGLKQAGPFWELLKNPMMLTVYCKTCEELNHHQDIDFFKFYEEYQTKAELMSNYLESLAAKRFMQVREGKEKQKELILVLYVVHFVLPYLAYQMESRSEFAIESNKIYQGIELLLQSDYATSSFVKRWFGQRGISDIQYLSKLDAAEIVEYLKNFSTVFYQDKSWHYTHHHFRDALSAQFSILACEKGLLKDEIPRVLRQVWSEESIEFVGELLGVYRESYATGREDVLHRMLNMLRRKPATEIRIPLYNILQIWKGARGNLAGEDFSSLDLKGQILEPYLDGNGGILKTDFTDAVVYPENLLPVGHKGVVSNLCYSPDGKFLATLGDDGDICLWDVPTGQLIRKMKMENHSFGMGLEFSRDSQLLAAASFKNTAVLEVENGAQKYCFTGHEDVISHIAFHPSGLELASGGHDERICIWDMRTGAQCLCLENREEEDMKYYRRCDVPLCYSPDGAYLAAGFGNGTIRVWEAQTGRLLYNIKAHQGEIQDINTAPTANTWELLVEIKPGQSGMREPVTG